MATVCRCPSRVTTGSVYTEREVSLSGVYPRENRKSSWISVSSRTPESSLITRKLILRSMEFRGGGGDGGGGGGGGGWGRLVVDPVRVERQKRSRARESRLRGGDLWLPCTALGPAGASPYAKRELFIRGRWHFFGH